MKHYDIYDFKNDLSLFMTSENFIKLYLVEEFKDDQRKKLIKKIKLEKDFTLDVSTLKELKNAHNKRVDNLLKHLEFNPFKEDLRKEDKEEYSYYPFEWKGTRYYLYPRMGFEIDRDIERSFSFIKLLEAQINANQPLIFKFNEQSS